MIDCDLAICRAIPDRNSVSSLQVEIPFVEDKKRSSLHYQQLLEPYRPKLVCHKCCFRLSQIISNYHCLSMAAILDI